MPEATQAPTPSQPKLVTITLDEPLTRGETQIATMTLRKPSAGELRGLSLSDLIQADVSTVLRLIPRISDPILTEHEAGQLSASDIAEVAGEIRGFFMNKAERATMEAMIAEQTSPS